MSVLDRNLAMLVRDTGRVFAKKFDQRVRRLGVTLAQCRVLGQLSRNEGLSQAELADLLEVEPITLARLIDRMEAAGWVQRRADPSDRRVYRLFLSEKVKPLLTEIVAVSAEVNAEALAGIPPAEAELLFSLLNRVYANLSDRAPAAGCVESRALA